MSSDIDLLVDATARQLNDLCSKKIRDTVSFKATIMLRNTLIEKGGFTITGANDIVGAIKVEIADQVTDQQLERLVDPFAGVLSRMYAELLREHFNHEQIIKILNNAPAELVVKY